MDIRTETDDRGIVLHIDGNLDERGAEALRRKMSGIYQGKAGGLVLDFSGVSYIGSSGIGVLILAYKQLSKKNTELVIKGLSQDIYELMKSLDLHKLMALEKKTDGGSGRLRFSR